MLGIVCAPGDANERLAPSVPPALYPVGGEPVVARTVGALSEAADEVVVVTSDSDVRAAVESTDVAASILWPAEFSSVRDRLASDHDRVLVAAGSTYVERADLVALAADAPAVAVRPQSDGSPPLRGPAATRAVPAGTVRDADSLADLTADALEPDAAEVVCEHHYDVRRPWELLAATERALASLDRRIDGDVHPDADCRGAVVVVDDARVDAGVVVEGPAYVSAGATVGPNAYVRGSTYLGTGSHVGHGVEVKNCVLFEEATVPHLTYLGDSVMGPGTNVGAGSLVANLRHDDRAVEVTHDGERVSTGRRKFGAVVGAGARLGIGTRLNVGVTLGAGATTTPGETVLRDVEGAGR